MSNVYIQEPVTKGKVCLKTSVGDIDIELWSKECPKACRNFVQLCMEGYYDGLSFHRLVPDFIVQGGDPTGTGMGGDSVYGTPFKDEFHSRLRFSRRGLVGCANGGKKDDNNSQFFFTLGPTPELQGKHTLFGRVVGDTLFNMLKLGEGEVDQNEKPKLLRKIVGAEIISNPFDDIVPRKLERKKDDKNKRPESKAKATKNFGLLSFGDEAEEEEEAAIQITSKFGKAKSAHDVLENDPSLSKDAAVAEDELGKADSEEEKVALPTLIMSGERERRVLEEEDEESKKRALERVRKKLAGTSEGPSSKKKRRNVDGEDDDLEGLLDREARAADEAKKNAVREEIRTLQKQMVKELRKKDKVEEEEEEEELSEAMAMYRNEKKRYIERVKDLPKPKTSIRESQTLEMLEKFKNKLKKVVEDKPAPPKDADQKVKEYRKRLGEEYEEEVKEEEEELIGEDWMTNKFETEMEELRRAKDVNVEDFDKYDIYDPRNPINKRRREGQEMGRQIQTDMHREWMRDREQ